MHFLVKIHFGSSVSCKCNIYFGWSLEIQVIYVKKGCGALYGVKMLEMMFVRHNANLIYLMKFLNFRTHFGGTSQIENKIGKNICV